MVMGEEKIFRIGAYKKRKLWNDGISTVGECGMNGRLEPEDSIDLRLEAVTPLSNMTYAIDGDEPNSTMS